MVTDSDVPKRKGAMRRSLRALLSLGLLALISTGAASASAEHRSPARAAILCLGGSGLPCCVPVVTEPSLIPCCVPTIIKCTALLTISSSRDPSTARQAVEISGRVMPATGAAGTTATLWQELPGQKSFHRVAQTKTDSTGAYKFRRQAGSVQTNRSWFVAAIGLKSLPLTQMVKAVVSLTVSAKKTGNGESVTFKGHVTPSHAGERIRLQERSATGWKLIASVRLTGSSTFSMRKSFVGSRSALVRAALGADSRNVASHSATVHTKL
jgi:hypothetical protein